MEECWITRQVFRRIVNLNWYQPWYTRVYSCCLQICCYTRRIIVRCSCYLS